MATAFDLDGTLYDTLPVCLAGENYARKILEIPDLTVEELKSKLQTSDWTAFYLSIGIKEDQIEEYDRLFFEHYNKQIPPIIPGAKEMLIELEGQEGHENIYIITNAPKEAVQLRFERDGLLHYMDRVHSPKEGKVKELCELAEKHGSIIYVGDLKSDADSCRKAIETGANVHFFAMLHEYCMNHPQEVEEYIREYEWTTGVRALAEIPKLVQQNTHPQR